MKNRDHTRLLCNGVVNFIAEFQQNPFKFLYERDIQSVLYARLYDTFYSNTIQLVGGYHTKEEYGGSTKIKTVPVHCEQNDRGRPFDIVLIDDGQLIPYSESTRAAESWANDKFWRQPLRAAIEIKYHQLGDTPSRRINGFNTDYTKLQAYGDDNRNFLGIALLFVQSLNQDSFRSTFSSRLVSRAKTISPARIIAKARKPGTYQLVVTARQIYEILGVPGIGD